MINDKIGVRLNRKLEGWGGKCKRRTVFLLTVKRRKSKETNRKTWNLKLRKEESVKRNKADQESICLIHYGEGKTGNLKEISKKQKNLIKVSKL
jgi:hypothetical protein